MRGAHSHLDSTGTVKTVAKSRGASLAGEDACGILVDFPEEILKTVAATDVVIIVSPGVSTGAVEPPLGVFRALAEFCHDDIDPLIGLHESWALFDRMVAAWLCILACVESTHPTSPSWLRQKVGSRERCGRSLETRLTGAGAWAMVKG